MGGGTLTFLMFAGYLVYSTQVLSFESPNVYWQLAAMLVVAIAAAVGGYVGWTAAGRRLLDL